MTIRQATDADAGELRALLNGIVREGGTTAIEDELTETEFTLWFLSGPDCVACHVAVLPDTSIAGFQALATYGDLPDGWVDIATFTRRPRIGGVGSALFPVTRDFASRAGFTMINATIRADNAGGLAYYAKLGFTDYSVAVGVALRDGTPVDRVSRRYALR
ncbi:MAG: GNAT family N-acetyltransferase [Hoeflea sp.]|uniref:GNAT family N-acetyltransferase n=1 Tax=Hoeflea sp. TaxID=1940281 RepID=UPI000C0D3811|nr:GNAT family N-acetyltransferase [Hoeflea sp.]PHR19745.1 MAG: GNAT family N-acetyltransferase [Hoeflea sp.]